MNQKRKVKKLLNLNNQEKKIKKAMEFQECLVINNFFKINLTRKIRKKRFRKQGCIT